jgi:hypothetical protein
MFQMPWLALVNKTVSDSRFKSDPNYFGDTGEFIYGRVETGYARIAYKSIGFFGGRVSRNWGIYGTPSLILSDNPYSYDHFGFQASSRRFRFTFYASRLEDRNGIDVQSKNPSVIKTKRYFSIQRFDFSPRPNLQFGATEVAVYGGENQNSEAAYLNPMNLFYVDQRNQRIQMNGLWCFDGYWKPSNSWSLFVQYLIDDIIVNNEPGQNDRARHPDRMGLSVKLVNTDMLASGLQCGLSYHRVGNWTYMSYRTWENYHYHGLGMGYPKNSVEGFGAEADYFASPPFVFHAAYAFEREGEQDMTAPFGDTREKFPLGIVQKTQIVDVSARFMPGIRFQALVQIRWQGLKNAFHVEGKAEDLFEASVQLFYNFNVAGWL